MLSRPFFFISLWFRRRIVKLLGLNFGLGVVSMIETWCSCCIGVVSTSFYPISSILGLYREIFDGDPSTNNASEDWISASKLDTTYEKAKELKVGDLSYRHNSVNIKECPHGGF